MTLITLLSITHLPLPLAGPHSRPLSLSQTHTTQRMSHVLTLSDGRNTRSIDSLSTFQQGRQGHG